MKSNVLNNIQTSNESNLVESIIINNDTEVFLKDSLECSISTHTKSSTNILIPDSLNKQKNSQLIGNYTPISNTKQPLILKKKLMNKKKISSNDNTLGTKKIDYRYHPSYPMNVLDNARIKKYYWLAVYDKLIMKKNIIKILNYFSEKSKTYEDTDIKEKIIILKDFDIFFGESSNKPYIKYLKGGYIFAKLYLFTLEEMNFIISYINHFEVKINPFLLETLQKKGSFQIIDNNKIMNTNIIYCMGIYMNVCIYSFSSFNEDTNHKNFKTSPRNINNLKKQSSPKNFFNENSIKYPESKKLAKLIKILIQEFPKYSIDFFICYLLSKIKNINYKVKSDEIKHLLYNNACSNQYFNINNTNYFNQKNKKYCFPNQIISLNTPYISLVKKIKKIQQNSFIGNSTSFLCSSYRHSNDIKKSNTIITSKNKIKIKSDVCSYDNKMTIPNNDHLYDKRNHFSKKNSNKNSFENYKNNVYQHINNQSNITNSNNITNKAKFFPLNSNRNTFSNKDLINSNKLLLNKIYCPKNIKNRSFECEKKLKIRKIKMVALTAINRDNKKNVISKGVHVVSRSLKTQDNEIDDNDSFIEKYNIKNKKYMKNGVICVENSSNNVKNSEVSKINEHIIYETPGKKTKRNYY